MRSALKLSHKAILLIVIPLSFEIGFVAVLYATLEQTEREVERAVYAKNIAASFNLIVKRMMSAASMMYMYANTQLPSFNDKFDSYIEAIPAELAALRKQLRDDPVRLRSVTRFDQLIRRGMMYMDEARRQADFGESSQSKELLSNVQKLLDEMSSEMDLVTRDLKDVVTRSDDTQREYRQLVKRSLLIGVGINVALAVILAVVFYKSTMERLSVLMDNTHRFGRGQRLNEPLTGSDEIGRLDRVFHDMAAAIAAVAAQKKEFMAMITHDLRSPLTSIRATVEMIGIGSYDDIKVGENGHQVVGRVENNLDRLIALINDLLDVEKLEAGSMDMSFEYVPVDYVLNSTDSALKDFAGQSEVELVKQPSEEELYGDGKRLVQVLVNLVSNAIKYSPAGGKVYIEAKADPDWVTFVVTDEGPGIPENKRSLVFERFKQLEDASERKQGSSGLGLAICKNIVEQHGGTIGVTSRDDNQQGSSFWFKVPATKEILDVALATARLS